MQNDLGDYLYGPPDYGFQVDHTLEKDLQLNVDMTVAMPCRCEVLHRFRTVRSLILPSPLHRSQRCGWG